ncbi:hypothetical protein RFI_25804, partial [Reticulomyxa filosa]
ILIKLTDGLSLLCIFISIYLLYQASSFALFLLTNTFKVLKPALIEINDKTGLEIQSHIQKKDRKVSAVAFSINRKAIPMLPHVSSSESNIDIIDIVTHNIQFEDVTSNGIKLGLTKKYIYELLGRFKLNKITNVFDLVIYKVKQGHKILNIEGYIWTLLTKRTIEQTTSSNAKRELVEIIKEAQDDIRRKILIACAEIIDPITFISIAKTLKIITIKEIDEEIVVTIFIDYKFIFQKEFLLERRIGDKINIKDKKYL